MLNAINGLCIPIEPFQLFRYLDEQAFRFNNRKDKAQASPLVEVRRIALEEPPGSV